MFSQRGNILTFTNSSGATLAAGEGLLIGGTADHTLGVVQDETLDTADGELAVEGTWNMPKTTGQAWAFGVPLYWNLSGKILTTVSSGGSTVIGFAAQAELSASATGIVRLTP